MKFNHILSAVGLVATSVTAAPAAVAPTPDCYLQTPSVKGRQFYLNGKTQRFAGVNAWWLGHLYTDTDVDFAAQEIAASGIQVARVWGFGNSNVNDTSIVYYQLLNSTGAYINYGTNGIARLDSAIKYAEKYKIKLVLPMLNNFDDLGGINTYSAAFGCNATTFYTDPNAQAAYRGWIKFVINRYKKSPAIFAWELMNEPRCRQCPTSVITNWATSVSQYIKSLDSTHLVALGDEGWFADATYGDGSYPYSGYEGVNFLDNIKIKTLDYATVHLYPQYWGQNNSWGNTWIAQHADAAKKAGKPVVLEEYGYQYTSDADRIAGNNQWQDSARSSGFAADQIWQFGTVLPSAGTGPFDSFAVYYNATAGSVYNQIVVQNAQKWAKAPVLN